METVESHGSEEEALEDIMKTIAVLNETFETLDPAGVEVYQEGKNAYRDPSTVSKPIVIKSPERQVCVEKEGAMINAKDNMLPSIDCQVKHVEVITEAGLAVWKFILRHQKVAGNSRYGETIKYAQDCADKFHDLFVYGHGGARKGQFEMICEFTEDEFHDDHTIEGLYNAIDADSLFVHIPSAAKEKVSLLEGLKNKMDDEKRLKKINALLMAPDIIDQETTILERIEPSDELMEMKEKTAKYRSTQYDELNKTRKYNIRKLDRLLIQECYREQSPQKIEIKPQELDSTLAEQIGKSREVIQRYRSDAKGLTEDTLDFYIVVRAPKDFFDKVRKQKNDFIRDLEEVSGNDSEDDIGMDNEYISSVISDNVMIAYSQYVKKQPISDFRMFTKEEIAVIDPILSTIYQFILENKEPENEALDDESTIVTLPPDQKVKIEILNPSETEAKIIGIAEQLTACAKEEISLPELATKLEKQVTELVSLIHAIRNIKFVDIGGE
jgi:hypothetical protein